MVTTKDDKPTTEQDVFQAAFAHFENQGGQTRPAWLFPMRKAGLARFTESGIPTTKAEDWRFTSLRTLARRPFAPVFEPSDAGLSLGDLKRFPFSGLEADRLVFVNGFYAASLSSVEELPAGVTVRPLAEALAESPDELKQHLGQLAVDEKNPFPALNTAFFTDGAFIHVARGQQAPRPVHLLFVTTRADAGFSSQPRNLVIAGESSALTVLETHVSTVEGDYFVNAVNEYVVGDHARVEHCKFQDESTQAFHLAALHARIGRAANFTSHSIALGAALSRNNLRTELNGEGLEAVLNGLYLTNGTQLADHHMIVEHNRPHCDSHEYFNGILDGESRGVFHGRIYVAQEAQKTDAKQTNKNILLSDRAVVDTKPQLEIYADDVKCTHGATIGQMDTDSIFYLQARGIDLDTARRMLLHGFAGEIIERIQCEPVREEIDRIVWDRLEQGLGESAE